MSPARLEDENLPAVLLQPSLSFYKQLEGRGGSGKARITKCKIVSLTTTNTTTTTTNTTNTQSDKYVELLAIIAQSNIILECLDFVGKYQ